MTDGDLVRQTYELLGKGDVRAVLGMFDEKIEWTEAEGFPYAGTYTGGQAIVENVLMRLGTEWVGFESPPEQIVDGGEGTVIAYGWYGGSYKATGKPMKARFAHIWQIRNGRVTRFEQVVDSAKVNEAMT